MKSLLELKNLPTINKVLVSYVGFNVPNKELYLIVINYCIDKFIEYNAKYNSLQWAPNMSEYLFYLCIYKFFTRKNCS